jgi:hypothetical protein
VAPARITARAFPAYAHRLGVTPHPLTDPRGHSFGLVPTRTLPVPANLSGEWRVCAAYLWGVDLFNHGYWWEAHEAWEEPWKASARESPEARYLQGLIQVAAAALQQARGRGDGAARLMARARDSLAPVLAALREAPGDRFMGLALVAWWAEVERSVAPPPVIVLR